MSEPIGIGIGLIKGGLAVHEYLRRRRGFEKAIAKAVVKAVPRIQNEGALAEFVKDEDVHWCLILGPEDAEADLTARIAAWLAEAPGVDLGDPDVQHAATAAARVAMVSYVTSADDEEHRLLQDFRLRQLREEIRASRTEHSDEERLRTDKLPWHVAQALVSAATTDDEAARTLADILHRDDSPESVAFDAAEFAEATTNSPAYRYVGLAAAEFAAAKSVQPVLQRLAETLAARPTPDAASLLVRAAINAQRNDGERLLDMAAELDPHDVGPEIMRADWADDWATIIATVPADTTDILEAQYLARALVHDGQLQAAIRVLDHAAANNPANSVALTKAAGLRLALFGTETADGQVVVGAEPRTISERAVLERARSDATLAAEQTRRRGGDASEALVVAVQAASRLHDAVGALAAVRTDDGYVPEIANAEVATAVAGAAAIVQDHRTLEDVIELVPEGFDREMVLGFYYSRVGGSRDLALRHYERALDTAPDTPSLLRPLFALAYEAKSLPVETLERVRAELPEEATIVEAVAAQAQGLPAEAMSILDSLPEPRQADPQIDVIRTECLVAVGRTNEAVQTLDGLAERTGEAMFLLRATGVLEEAGRSDDAIVFGERHLTGLGPADQQRMRSRLIELAFDATDWVAVERHATEGLAQGQVPQSQGRWALILALANQGKHRQAYDVLVDGPLDARTDVHARLSAALRARFGTTAADANAVLDIADQYPDSEEIRATVLAEFMMMPSKANMPTTALGRFRQHLERFQQDFPESERLVAVPVTDDFAEVLDFMRRDPVPEEVRNLLRRVFAGDLPLGMASAVGRTTYLETVVRPPTGFRFAATTDLSAAGAERAAATSALDDPGSIVVDLSTVALLVAADLDPYDILGPLGELVVSGESARDAEMGRLNLERRPTMFTSTDHEGRLTVDEIGEAEANRRAELADRIKRFVDDHCTVIEVQPDDSERLQSEWPFATAYLVAKQRGMPLVADDVPVRQLAASESVPTFGTVAIAQASGSYTSEFQDTLRRIAVADLPFDLSAYLRLAADDDWAPEAAAVPLVRPPTLADPDAWQRYLGEAVRATAGDKPAAAGGWCRAAAVGFTFATGLTPEQAAGAVLTVAIIVSATEPAVIPYLLAGTRSASIELGGTDPLSVAAKTIADMFRQDDPTTSAQRFAAVFSECEEQDRLTAGHEFLKP